MEKSNSAMSRKKLSTTIYVTPEQNDALKLLHARTKVPIAVYIREGIDMVLNTYSHLLPGQLPLAALQAPDEGATGPGGQQPPGPRHEGNHNAGGQHASSGAKK